MRTGSDPADQIPTLGEKPANLSPFLTFFVGKSKRE
jgi:hypothetical protein